MIADTFPRMQNGDWTPICISRDLLFTRLSGTLEYVRNCAVVAELDERRLEFPDRIFRGRCVPSMSPHFIQHTFADKTLRRSLEVRWPSQRQVTRESHCLTSGNSAYNSHPSPEQHRIVAEVELRLSVIQHGQGHRRGEHEAGRATAPGNSEAGHLRPTGSPRAPTTSLRPSCWSSYAPCVRLLETAMANSRKSRRPRSRPSLERQLLLSEQTP